MSVRRKSNWYIYLIAFGITLAFAFMAIIAFRSYLFPDSSQSEGLDASGELSDSFVPDSSQSFNMIVMISDGEDDMPQLFIMTAYDAVESRLTFIPIPNGISVSLQGRTLPNVYSAKGGSGVIDALNAVTGVECTSYVVLDRSSFMNLASACGNVQFNVPRTIIIADGVDAETINAGSQLFTSEMLYRYIMLAEYEDGESYRFNMVGSILAELINQNYNDIDSSLLDTFASLLMSAPDTDITEEKYNAHKAALLNTIQYGTSPAEYYVPYGTYDDDDGGFVISDNSITTIRQKTGVE